MQNKHEEDLFDNANQFFLKNRFLNFKFKERVSIKIFLRFTLKLLWISTTLLLIFTLQYIEQDIVISRQLISTIYSNALCVKMFALIFLVIYLKSVKREFGSVQTLFQHSSSIHYSYFNLLFLPVLLFKTNKMQNSSGF